MIEQTVVLCGGHGAGPGPISDGVSALRREAVELLRSPASLDTDPFPRLAAEGGLHGIVCGGEFVDVGILETLPGHVARFPSFSAGRPPFSTATACSTTMTGMSGRSRGSAGSTARRRRSRRSTMPACSSFLLLTRPASRAVFYRDEDVQRGARPCRRGACGGRGAHRRYPLLPVPPGGRLSRPIVEPAIGASPRRA